MTISFYTGGARSGKSLSAEKRTLCYGSQAVYIATSEILDDEMAQRIENHIERRGSNWQTLEIPLDLKEERCLQRLLSAKEAAGRRVSAEVLQEK